MQKIRFVVIGMLLVLSACGSSTPAPNVNQSDLDGSASETVSGIRVVKLSGTRHQLGYQHGYYLANEILDLEENYVFKIAEEYAMYGYDYKYIRSMVDELTFWDIGSVEELEGILEGVEAALGSETMLVTPPGENPRKVDLLDIKVANALPDWFSGPQCSAFAIWGDARKDKGTLHARNFDFTYPGEDGILINDLVLFVFKSTDENRSWISVSWPGLIGCLTCINEDGMSIAVHDVGGEHPSEENGFLPRTLAARHAVAQGNSIIDSETLLEEYPIYYASNFHIAFPEEGRTDDEISASFEIGGDRANPDGGVTIRHPSELETNKAEKSNFMIVTNHWLKRESSIEDFYLEESLKNYNAILDALDSEISGDGEVGLEDAVNILQSVEAANNEGLTIYSTYFAPDEGRFWLSIAKDLESPAPESDLVEFNLGELF